MNSFSTRLNMIMKGNIYTLFYDATWPKPKISYSQVKRITRILYSLKTGIIHNSAVIAQLGER